MYRRVGKQWNTFQMMGRKEKAVLEDDLPSGSRMLHPQSLSETTVHCDWFFVTVGYDLCSGTMF
jgi:hypothetical protein